MTRPDSACVTHRPPGEGRAWRLADPGYRCCSSCYDRIHRWLSPIAVDDDGWPDSIPGLYAVLNPRPGASGDNGRRAPGFGPRSPANDHLISMRDKRSVKVVLSDPLSVPGVLAEWCDALIEERGLVPPARTVQAMARFLDSHLDWTSKQAWVEDFHEELRALHSQLRAIGAQRRKIGACPNTIQEGEHTRECGAVLLAPLNGDSIRCFACGREWQRDEWIRLGRLLAAG